MVENIEETTFFWPISSLIGKSFVVKDYQRGYKWGKKEILELLKDIDEHSPSDGKYCLQPIIIRQNTEVNSIELIDGQQRVTSLYLLLTYLTNSNKNIYAISYETRTESKDFLENKILDLNDYLKEDLKWEQFTALEGFDIYDNVDVYHFYNVYKHIYNWFRYKDDVFKNDFLSKILYTVHVIWYDVDKSIAPKENITAEEIFLNLNAGKILLTSSELIKALFILECQNNYSKEVCKLKASELALEWDYIENKLQDKSFWYFICDSNEYVNSSTKIDYLFDIVNKKRKKDDTLYSYRVYEKRFKEKENLNWLEVKNTFNKLYEWYEDKELYHYVGYLIVSKIKTLHQIIEKSKGISKTEFKKELINFIKIEFKILKKDDSGVEYHVYNLENLDYTDSRKECEKLLVLLNIQYYVNNSSDHKFPFELYKGENWSVEHINPQNPREFENVGTIKNWLTINKEYFTKEEDTTTAKIVKRIDAALLNFSKIEMDDKRKLIDLKWDKAKLTKLDELIDVISESLSLHQISNLALLDRNSNSKLSNKLFLQKRELILKFDRDGKYITSKDLERKVFIPVCTKNVFSKIYTTDNESVANTFFGRKDMACYYAFIQDQLKTFLP